MNIKQAKSIPLDVLMERLGYQPDHARQAGNDIWYKSPFRTQEKDASFHINRAKNVWYDFGGGLSEGGTVIDLVMKLEKCNTKGALSFLERIFANGISRRVEAQNEIPVGGVGQGSEIFTLDEVRRDISPVLTQYIIDKRKISLASAIPYISQVHFSNQQGKKYFAIGMKNREGGWEVRNPYFKGSIGKKGMTYIEGASREGISIFEGMFDFLTALTYYGQQSLMQNDVLVLHSLSFQQQAIAYLKERSEYRNLKLYFDNDQSGHQAFENFKSYFPDRVVEPCFALYFPHNDFNDFLVAKASNK